MPGSREGNVGLVKQLWNEEKFTVTKALTSFLSLLNSITSTVGSILALLRNCRKMFHCLRSNKVACQGGRHFAVQSVELDLMSQVTLLCFPGDIEDRKMRQFVSNLLKERAGDAMARTWRSILQSSAQTAQCSWSIVSTVRLRKKCSYVWKNIMKSLAEVLMTKCPDFSCRCTVVFSNQGRNPKENILYDV